MTIARKFSLALALMFAVIVIALSVLGTQITRNEIMRDARNQSAAVVAQTERLLSVVDGLMLERVHLSMQYLLAHGTAIGQPRLGERVTVKDRQVSDLLFGDLPQTNNFGLVDNVAKVMGGTATLFVKSGPDYVRVSTNVMTENGRAIGTVLDPKGKAFAAIESGQSYYGLVDILGNPYITGYEPMKNTRGEVVGIWYVGFKANLTQLENFIRDGRVLDNGFLVLFDHKKKMRNFSGNVDENIAKSSLDGSVPKRWMETVYPLKVWGYTLVVGVDTDEVNAEISKLSTSIWFGVGLVGIVLLGIILLMLRTFILRPLHQIHDRVHNITEGDGDLTLRLNLSGRDELAVMAQSFDRLLSQIQQTIQGVKQTSVGVIRAASDVGQIARNTDQSLVRQLEQTGEVAQAVDAMTDQIETVNGQISVATELARKTDQQASAGSALLENMIQAIGDQVQGIDGAVGVIRELNQATDNIGKVLDVIRAIAEQTNLLALNAAIEAARAGEQGRGFAVVADEVRMLATRTQSSTQEIQTMIEQLQRNSDLARQVMQKNQGSAVENQAQIRYLAENLQQIIDSISELNLLNKTITASTATQNQRAGVINATVQQINQVTQQTRSSSVRTLQTSEQLSASAAEMEQTIQRFRT